MLPPLPPLQLLASLDGLDGLNGLDGLDGLDGVIGRPVSGGCSRGCPGRCPGGGCSRPPAAMGGNEGHNTLGQPMGNRPVVSFDPALGAQLHFSPVAVSLFNETI